MRITHALGALLIVGAACARPGEEPESAADQTAAREAPMTVAQATVGKPLIHVWKSPT